MAPAEARTLASTDPVAPGNLRGSRVSDRPIASEDGVHFETLIRTMDTVLTAGCARGARGIRRRAAVKGGRTGPGAKWAMGTLQEYALTGECHRQAKNIATANASLSRPTG